ncbi:MAG: hypothetical protein K5930_03450 [Treponemataceae bacterium]|nr:hypothetical protein [Treponemataceae bacterium]
MKKIIVNFITLLNTLFLFISCNKIMPLNTENFLFNSSSSKEIIDYSEIKNNLISNAIENMSLKSKIAQMLLVSVDGACNTENISLYTGDYPPGGFLLFKFNVDSSEYKEIKSFADDLKNTYTSKNQIAPYISIDHEGGDVNRLKKIFPELPSQEYIASVFSLSDAEKIYYYHSKMLEKIGLNINLAPITEIKTVENKKFLVDRSFGNRKNVYEYCNSALWGICQSNILPVQKHFPGNTNDDTHTGKSVIYSDMDTIKKLYIGPFQNMRNKNSSAVMMSHTILDALDSKPSCISEKTVNLFKENTGFDGLLFTDDLTMEALSESGYPLKKAMLEAIDAGVDVIMLSITNYIRIVDNIINEIEGKEELIKKIDKAVEKILNWKIDCGLIKLNLFSDIPKLSYDIEFAYSEEEENSFWKYHELADKLLENVRNNN